MTWTPTSQFAPKEPDVWEQIEAVYGKPFAELKTPVVHKSYSIGPKLILEPIPPKPKRYTITLEETDETRAPQRGEHFLDSNGLPDVAVIDFRNAKYPILRVVSREAL